MNKQKQQTYKQYKKTVKDKSKKIRMGKTAMDAWRLNEEFRRLIKQVEGL